MLENTQNEVSLFNAQCPRRNCDLSLLLVEGPALLLSSETEEPEGGEGGDPGVCGGLPEDGQEEGSPGRGGGGPVRRAAGPP